jgi:sigma-B regulation protein RsbU (phosphoserine phosphatase)
MAAYRNTAETERTGTTPVPGHVVLLTQQQSRHPLVADVLEAYGYRATQIEPEQLAETLADPTIDAILIDDTAGLNNLLEYLRQIRETLPLESTPVVLLAGSANSGRTADALKFGASAYLRPDGTGDELVNLLEVQLRLTAGIKSIKSRYAHQEQQHESLHQDLELSQKLQESFLPASKMYNANFNLEARLMAGGDLSGDYFDYALLSPDRLVIFLADVSGHGIASALLANRLNAFFEEHNRSIVQPALFMERLNSLILKLGAQLHIATAICAHIDVSDKVLTYASAGHRTMYLIDSDGAGHLEFETTGPALGMFEEFDINEVTRGFMPGRNRLVVFSDGLVEFKLPDDQWITEEQFRDDVMLPNASLPISDYVNTLLERSRELTGKSEWDDDVSLLVVDC